MVFSRLSTSSDATRAGASATAFLRASRSFRTALDQTKGRRRSDAFSFGRRIAPRQVNPAVPSLSRLTPAGSGRLTGCAFAAAPVHFIPARSVGANRRFAQTFAVTPASQGIRDLDLHLSRLSSSSSAGSTNASKRGQELGKVIQGRGRFIQGIGRHD